MYVTLFLSISLKAMYVRDIYLPFPTSPCILNLSATWWHVWMMILLTCKGQTSMHLSFDFFTSQCTHPLGSCINVQMKKCVHWFLSFALQQNHIQSLTSKQSNFGIMSCFFSFNNPHCFLLSLLQYWTYRLPVLTG